MTTLLDGDRPRATGLAALLHCPRCDSRELVDATPAAEDRGWWARLCCWSCGHEWAVRS